LSHPYVRSSSLQLFVDIYPKEGERRRHIKGEDRDEGVKKREKRITTWKG